MLLGSRSVISQRNDNGVEVRKHESPPKSFDPPPWPSATDPLGSPLGSSFLEQDPERLPEKPLGRITTIRESDPAALADRLCQDLRDHLQPEDLVCIPTGRSPELLYRLVENDPVSIRLWQQLRYLQLDEYIFPPSGIESFRESLHRQVFEPLKISPDRIHSIEATTDPEAETKRLDTLFDEIGPPRAVILGLGSNGHIAFNEPCDAPRSGYHVVDLSPMTIHDNFPEAAHEKIRAITIGLDQLQRSERIYLLVPQQEKAQILDRCLAGPHDPQIPASMLHEHPDLHVYRY